MLNTWIAAIGLSFPLFFALDARSESIERPPLSLATGEQRLLQIEGLSRFSIGGPQIRVLPLPKNHRNENEATILVKAVQPGLTDLWAWRNDGSSEHRRIRIEKAEIGAPRPELLHALSELSEVEVLYAGSSVILRGEVHSLSEATRLDALERIFPEALRNEARLSEELLARAETALLTWIHGSPWKNQLRLERADGGLRLAGNLTRAADLEPVRRRAHGLFPAIRLELDSLPDDAPTVHFRVYLLELRKNRLRDFGLGWPATQDAAFRVTSSAFQDLLQLDLALHALEANGSAHILSQPELVVRAPGEAELFSGGELPIQMQSHFYSNVSWKQFGLTLKLKISNTTAEKVRLEIFTEVSHLDASIATEGKIPGLQANRMRTQVDARYGAPLLLSGLLQESLKRTARGLPWLRDIPVFGALFGSEEWQSDRSELVAILVPSVSPPRPPMERMERRPPEQVPSSPAAIEESEERAPIKPASETWVLRLGEGTFRVDN